MAITLKNTQITSYSHHTTPASAPGGAHVPKPVIVWAPVGSLRPGQRFAKLRLRDPSGAVMVLTGAHVLGVRPSPGRGTEQVTLNFTQVGHENETHAQRVVLLPTLNGSAVRHGDAAKGSAHSPPTTTISISFEPVGPTYRPQ